MLYDAHLHRRHENGRGTVSWKRNADASLRMLELPRAMTLRSPSANSSSKLSPSAYIRRSSQFTTAQWRSCSADSMYVWESIPRLAYPLFGPTLRLGVAMGHVGGYPSISSGQDVSHLFLWLGEIEYVDVRWVNPHPWADIAGSFLNRGLRQTSVTLYLIRNGGTFPLSPPSEVKPGGCSHSPPSGIHIG